MTFASLVVRRSLTAKGAKVTKGIGDSSLIREQNSQIAQIVSGRTRFNRIAESLE